MLVGRGYDNIGGRTKTKRRLDSTLPQTHYTYAFLPERARMLVWHLRYIWHTCDTFGEGDSKVVECLLLGRKMKAKDAIWGAWGLVRRRRAQSNNGGDDLVDDKDGIIDNKDGKKETLKRFVSLC